MSTNEVLRKDATSDARVDTRPIPLGLRQTDRPPNRVALSATARRNLLPFAREPMPPCSSSPGRPGF
jgi:hypothetical protein